MSLENMYSRQCVHSTRLPDNPWDTTVRFSDVAVNEQKAKFDHRTAVLSCLFGDSTHAYSGCLDTGVREPNLSAEKVTSLGQHSDTLSALSYARKINTLIYGSWDQSFGFWEPRAPMTEVSNHTLPERVTTQT
ncbi:hypothetical protein DFH29DRAFT_1005789 [Suillus ampliporus]|nr:hypothetical protein DFH29DRAFT_1005789 [Suillus ampliporus]